MDRVELGKGEPQFSKGRASKKLFMSLAFPELYMPGSNAIQGTNYFEL